MPKRYAGTAWRPNRGTGTRSSDWGGCPPTVPAPSFLVSQDDGEASAGTEGARRATGVRWYRLAADQGHAEAQFNLGQMYFNGRGVPQDRTDAARWVAPARRRRRATRRRRSRSRACMRPARASSGTTRWQRGVVSPRRGAGRRVGAGHARVSVRRGSGRARGRRRGGALDPAGGRRWLPGSAVRPGQHALQRPGSRWIRLAAAAGYRISVRRPGGSA